MKSFLLKVLLTLSIVTAFTFKSSAVDANYQPTFYGVTYYQGIYSLVSTSAENSDFTRVFYDDDLEATGGIFYAEGLLYSHWLVYNPYGSVDKVEQYIYDVKTGRKVETRELTNEASGFAINYDETQDCVFGYFQNPLYSVEGGYYVFGRLRMQDDIPEELGITVSVYEPVIAVAINTEGQCYGIDYQGRLVSINKKNGVPTVIGDTGMSPENVPQSCCFDPLTGKFYWAAVASDAASGIYEINLETGASTLVVELSELEDGEGLMGLYIPYPDPTNESPAEVSEMELTFETTSLEGQVKFRAPSTTVGGDAITDQFKAYVFLDTTTVELDVMPGQEYTVDMEVSKNQMYNCRVWTMIGENRSAKHTVAKWIGADYPKAPTNLNVFEEDGKIVFTWDTPPATGLHEGYVNPEEITYIISRGTDLFLTGYTGNRYEEDLPTGMATYTYYIRSSYNDLNGGYAYSDPYVIGSVLTLPLDLALGGDNIDMFTVIDANSDGNTWQAGFGSIDYTSNSSVADDWLITPKIELEPGIIYHMTLTADAQKYFMDELIEVYMGTAANVDAMTDKLGDITVSKVEGSTYELEFTLNQRDRSQYNIGFHCVSTNGYKLMLRNLKIEAVGMSGIENVKTDVQSNDYYDMMGRKIATPQRGNIYIHDGKVIRY